MQPSITLEVRDAELVDTVGRRERRRRLHVRRPFLHPEILGCDLDRALDHPNQVGVYALQPITRQLAKTKAI